MIAAIFPGQGPIDQATAAGVEADPLLDLAGQLTGVDVRRLLRRGGRDLDRTEVLQPLITAISLATFARLPPVAGVVTGHSLGQLAAWSATGGISAEDAVRLAHRRGLAMAAQARRTPGGLIACAEPASPPDTVLALQNGPDEWIFAGPPEALVGGRRLRATGPWHHPWMAGAAAELEGALSTIPRSATHLPLIDDQGELLTGEIEAALVAQLSRPVDWPAVCRRLLALGVTTAVVLPPGRVLAAQCTRCAPGLTVLRTDPAAAFALSLEQLRCAPSAPT